MTYEDLTTEQKIVNLQAAGFRSMQAIEINQQQIQQINAEIVKLNSLPEPVKESVLVDPQPVDPVPTDVANENAEPEVQS